MMVGLMEICVGVNRLKLVGMFVVCVCVCSLACKRSGAAIFFFAYF